MAPRGFADKVAFVWKVADKLRGTFNLAGTYDEFRAEASAG